MKKVLSFLTFALMGTSAFAQGWTKPKLSDFGIQNPQPTGVLITGFLETPGAYGYLFNEESGAFFVGANEYGARASVSRTSGHKVFFEDMDGYETSWSIVNLIDEGKPWEKWTRTFAESSNSIWVDNNNGIHAKTWTITEISDEKFTIGNSGKVEETMAFPNMTLGVYLDKFPADDTRLYMADKTTAGNFGNTWYFTNEAEYETYTNAVKDILEEFNEKLNIYNLAVTLGKAIEDAENECADPLIDIADQKAVYNNTESTLEQLQAAIQGVKNKVDAWKNVNVLAKATLENPADITDRLANPNFDDITGWNGEPTKGGAASNPCAEKYNMAFDVNQTISNLPAGIYHVSAQGFYRHGYANNASQGHAEGIEETYDAYFYGNDVTAHIPSIFSDNKLADEAWGGSYVDSDPDNGRIPNNLDAASNCFEQGLYKTDFLVYVYDTDELTIGAKKESADTPAGNWSCFDNFQVEYVGNTADSWSAFLQQSAENAGNWMDANSEKLTSEVTTCLAAAIAAAENTTGKTVEQIIQMYKDINTAVDKAKAVLVLVDELYTVFYELGDAYEEYYDSASPEAVEKAEELISTGEDYTELTAEQLKQRIEDMKACIAALRIPDYSQASDENPIDFTQVILNPDFETDNINDWTLVKREGATGNYRIQSGFDGKGMEFWSASSNTNKFDFYQEIINLPAGTYKLTADASNSLNGQEPNGDGRAYIYAAKSADKIKYVNADPVAVQEEDCASKYANYSVIFKLNEGETLRIGAASVGDLEARWVMVDNFHLEYYGTASVEQESKGKEVHIELVGGPLVPEIELDVEDGAQVDPAETTFINIAVAVPDGLSKEDQVLVEATLVDEQGNTVQTILSFTTFEDGTNINITNMAVDKNYTINITHIGYGEVVDYDEETYMPIFENEFVADEGDALASLHFAVMGPKMKYQALRKSIIDEMNDKIDPETKYYTALNEAYNAALAAGDQATTDDDYIQAAEDLQAAADAIFASIEAYQDLEDLRAQILEDSGEIQSNDYLELLYALMTDVYDDAEAAFGAIEESYIPASLLEDVIAPIVVLTECTYSTETVKTVTEAISNLYDVCLNPAPMLAIENIYAIGTVEYTTDCKDLIDAARTAYDELTEEQQALITEEQLQVLTDAEAEYARLKAIDDTEKAIDAIGVVEPTDECKALIDAAREAYDALSEDDQAEVENYQTLLNAEDAYSDYFMVYSQLELGAYDGNSYYATFSSRKPVFVEFTANVLTVKVTDTKLKLDTSTFFGKDVTEEVEEGYNVKGTWVPANTGVLLKSYTNNVRIWTYGNKKVNKINNVNFLRPAAEEMQQGYKFYMLAYGDEALTPQTLGFYYGAEDGAPFEARQGSAYLAVPENVEAKGFCFADDATAIKNVDAEDAANATYNLQGQRVKSSQKGIVIVNGKKVVK